MTDFGAVPNDDMSDKQALKLTIAAAQKFRLANKGQGIIIYFGEGTFILHDQKDAASIDPNNKKQRNESQSIFVELSNLIIKGARAKKTTLLSKVPLLAADESKIWTTPYLLKSERSFKQELVGKITESYRGGSTMSVKVDVVKNLSAGDFIELVGTIKNEEKIKASVLPYELEVNIATKKFIWTDLTEGLIKREKHKIVKIEGNTLYLSTPIAHDIDSNDDWKVNKIKPIEEFGVEDLTFAGNWHQDFVHHKNADHDGGFSLLELNNCTNSCVKNVTFKDFSRALNVSQCFNITLENITLEGKQGHQTVSVNHSNNVLSKNIFDNANGWHAPGVSNYAVSNVYLNMTYHSTSMSDLHGKQSMINLFDNTAGGWVLGRWGAATINQPNHLGGLMYWNHKNTSVNTEKFKAMNPDSEYGRLIMPHLIGLHGNPLEFESQSSYAKSIKAQNKAEYKGMLSNEPQAYLESMGKPVWPQSLYEAQYNYRKSLKK